MSIYPSPDKLDQADSKYELVILAAKRARQLKDNGPRLIDTQSPNLLTVALEELADQAIVKRVVEDASVSAQQAALKPTTPSLEDIIGAGPVLPIDIETGEGDQVLSPRIADAEIEDEDDSHDGDDELVPVDQLALADPGLTATLDDDDADIMPGGGDGAAADEDHI